MSSRQHAILIIDDEPVIRQALKVQLSKNAFQISEAETVSESISALTGAPCDLVLLDITLPDGNGMDVLRFMQRERIGSKVIVLTGTPGLERAIECVKLGAVDYITKPYKISYLMHSIHKALALETYETSA